MPVGQEHSQAGPQDIADHVAEAIRDSVPICNVDELERVGHETIGELRRVCSNLTYYIYRDEAAEKLNRLSDVLVQMARAGRR